jgi:hypothetical protein
MQSKQIEDSIIYWANRHLGTTSCASIEDMLDGEFFYSLLSGQSIEDKSNGDEFTFTMGNFEATLNILKGFYTEYDNIMEHSDYRDIVNNDIICTESHVVLITELVIGVLLK